MELLGVTGEEEEDQVREVGVWKDGGGDGGVREEREVGFPRDELEFTSKELGRRSRSGHCDREILL